MQVLHQTVAEQENIGVATVRVTGSEGERWELLHVKKPLAFVGMSKSHWSLAVPGLGGATSKVMLQQHLALAGL